MTYKLTWADEPRTVRGKRMVESVERRIVIAVGFVLEGDFGRVRSRY